MFGAPTIPGAIGGFPGNFGAPMMGAPMVGAQVMGAPMVGTMAQAPMGNVVSVQETVVPEVAFTTAEKWVEVPEMIVRKELVREPIQTTVEKRIQTVERVVEVPQLVTQEVVRQVPRIGSRGCAASAGSPDSVS